MAGMACMNYVLILTSKYEVHDHIYNAVVYIAYFC